MEHVGSTSVPSLVAKPVIDLALRMPEGACVEDASAALVRAGWSELVVVGDHWGTFLLVDRVRSAIGHIFDWEQWAQAHVRLFAEWLRRHEADRVQYADLKKALVSQGSWGDEYTAAKSWAPATSPSAAAFALAPRAITASFQHDAGLVRRSGWDHRAFPANAGLVAADGVVRVSGCRAGFPRECRPRRRRHHPRSSSSRRSPIRAGWPCHGHGLDRRLDHGPDHRPGHSLDPGPDRLLGHRRCHARELGVIRHRPHQRRKAADHPRVGPRERAQRHTTCRRERAPREGGVRWTLASSSA